MKKEDHATRIESTLTTKENSFHRRESERIVFLDYLRGVACLLVVFGHLFLIGLNEFEGLKPWMPGLSGHFFGADAAKRNVFSPLFIFLETKLKINVGAFGVALFFLISGFVILRAVERESWIVFMVRRVFRIYPVAIASVCVAALAMLCYCQIVSAQYPYSLVDVTTSAFVVYGVFHKNGVLPTMWTLEIELLFYVVLAAWASFGRPSFKSLLFLSALCALYTVVARWAVVEPASGHAMWALRQSAFDTLNVGYLLVGSIIYRMTTVPSKLRGFAFVASGVLVFFITRLAYSSLSGGYRGEIDAVNGLSALVVFLLALWSGMQWRWIRPLRWAADISYPLYLLHIPLGWVVLALLARAGWGMLESSVAAGMLVVVSASLVHIAIESPFRHIGAALTKRPRADICRAEAVARAD